MINIKNSGNFDSRIKAILLIALIILVGVVIYYVQGCGKDEPELGDDLIIKEFEADEEPEDDDVEIKLLGEVCVTVDLSKGEEYEEKGVEVIDRKTGNPLNKIKERIMDKIELKTVFPKDAEFDLKKPGFYTITYRYNEKVFKVRYVTIIGEPYEGTDGEAGEDVGDDEEETDDDEEGSSYPDTETVKVSQNQQKNPEENTTDDVNTDQPEEIPSAGGDSGNGDDGSGGSGSHGGGGSKPKPSYEMSGVSLSNKICVYNGKPQYIYLEGEIPDGVTYWEEGNGQIEAGTYTVTFHFKGDSKHQPIPDMTAKLTIMKAYYDKDTIKVSGLNVKYDGQKHYITITGIPEGVHVKDIVGDGQSSIGNHPIIIYLEGDNKNYMPIEPIRVTMVISEKDVYSPSEFVVEDLTVDYDGNVHKIVPKKVPSGVRYWSEGNEQTEAGSYDVIFHFEGNDMYQPIPDIKVKLTIRRVSYDDSDLSNIIIQGLEHDYDGTEKRVTVENFPPGVQLVQIEGDKKVEPGSYPVTIYLKGDNNHYAIEPIRVKMVIREKPEQEGMEAIRVSGWLVKYDGSSHYITADNIANLPGNVRFIRAEGDGQSVPGIHDVTLYFEGDNLHKPVEPVKMQMLIVEFEDETVTYNGGDYSLQVKNTFGFKFSYSGNGVSEVSDEPYIVTATSSRGGIYAEESITAKLLIKKNTSDPGDDKDDPDETDPDNPNGGDPGDDKDNPSTSNPDNNNPDSNNPDDDKDNPSTSNPDNNNPDSSNPDDDKDNPDKSDPDSSNPDDDKDNPGMSTPDATGPDIVNDNQNPLEENFVQDTENSEEDAIGDQTTDDQQQVEEATGNTEDEGSTEPKAEVADEKQVVETQPVEETETQTEEATEVVEGSDSEEALQTETDATSDDNENPIEQQPLDIVVPENSQEEIIVVEAEPEEALATSEEADAGDEDAEEKSEEVDSESDDKESDQ